MTEREGGTEWEGINRETCMNKREDWKMKEYMKKLTRKKQGMKNEEKQTII